ncbi:MAG: ParB/RepB/Spo0J family partition protein [Anaerolineae bacterium]|jgi:ParB family chromosome partitioning protein|nr:ParB/RepB/Spo0J family partition protein [Anaerolineae bacterium]
MSGQPRGLGKGLGALIPSATDREATSERPVGGGLLSVPVTDIVPNPRQPRGRIDADALAELSASIKEHGLIQPLIVTRAGPTARVPYQLIAGERRWRAAQLAGLETVPVVVKEATSQQMLELALVENIQRSDLNPLEEADAYQHLIDDFRLNQQEVADRVGKSRVAVANTLRLQRLPDRVKSLLADGVLTEGHARALLGLPEEAAMVEAAGVVVSRNLTVRQTEELVRRLSEIRQEPEPAEPEADDPDRVNTQRLEEAFRGALGTKVALTRGRKGGRLVISFYSDEELQNIYEKIVGETG